MCTNPVCGAFIPTEVSKQALFLVWHSASSVNDFPLQTPMEDKPPCVSMFVFKSAPAYVVKM